MPLQNSVQSEIIEVRPSQQFCSYFLLLFFFFYKVGMLDGFIFIHLFVCLPLVSCSQFSSKRNKLGKTVSAAPQIILYSRNVTCILIC